MYLVYESYYDKDFINQCEDLKHKLYKKKKDALKDMKTRKQNWLTPSNIEGISTPEIVPQKTNQTQIVLRCPFGQYEIRIHMIELSVN